MDRILEKIEPFRRFEIVIIGRTCTMTTNNGRHFTVELFNSISTSYGVCHIYTTAYNPRVNEACECFNKSMHTTQVNMFQHD